MASVVASASGFAGCSETDKVLRSVLCRRARVAPCRRHSPLLHARPRGHAAVCCVGAPSATARASLVGKTSRGYEIRRPAARVRILQVLHHSRPGRHNSGVARTRGRASIATAAFVVFNMCGDDPCARKLLARNCVAHSHKCSLLHYEPRLWRTTRAPPRRRRLLAHAPMLRCYPLVSPCHG